MPKIKLQSEYPDLDKYKNNFGNIIYCKKDTNIYHNPYGPAFISINGYKEYIIDNKIHRLDGPAKIWPDGYTEYWINNKCLTKEKFDIERLKFLGKEYLACLI